MRKRLKGLIAAGLAACALGVGASAASATPVTGWGVTAYPDAISESPYCQFRANGHWSGVKNGVLAFQVRLLQGGSQLGSIATYALGGSGGNTSGSGYSGPWIGGAPAGWGYTTQVRIWNYGSATGTAWGQGGTTFTNHGC